VFNTSLVVYVRCASVFSNRRYVYSGAIWPRCLIKFCDLNKHWYKLAYKIVCDEVLLWSCYACVVQGLTGSCSACCPCGVVPCRRILAHVINFYSTQQQILDNTSNTHILFKHSSYNHFNLSSYMYIKLKLWVRSLLARERIHRFASSLACLFLETKKRI
jgi:hypothetical protein